MTRRRIMVLVVLLVVLVLLAIPTVNSYPAARSGLLVALALFFVDAIGDWMEYQDLTDHQIPFWFFLIHKYWQYQPVG